MDFAEILDEFEKEFFRPEMEENVIPKCRKCGQALLYFGRSWHGQEEGYWQCPCGTTTIFE